MLPLPYIAIMLIFWVGVFYIIFQLMPSGEKQEIEERLGVNGVSNEISPLVSALRPLFILMIPLVAWVRLPRYRQWVEKRFINAGMAGGLTPDEFFAYKLLMAMVFWGLFIGLLCKTIISWPEPIWVDAIALAVGFFFPDAWIDGQVKERQANIRRSLPYVMDLLTLSVEAGLDFIAGISKVCEKAKAGPLVDEFAYMLGEIQLGASRQQALRNFAFRTDMPETRSFSALLIQADILGASVGPVLRAQSDLIRTQRFQRAERQGAYASQKILFPLILCIMPAVFVVIFGPIALNFIYGDQVIGM
jgi:tight adherence protein C